MTREQLITQVALRMDEVTPENNFIIPVDGADNNPLYELIDGLIDDGLLELYAAAPYWRLPQTSFQITNVKVETITLGSASRKIIRLKLGDDFLRVAEINCDDFQRSITEVFPEQSAEGKRQHNRFLMGREAKPVGVLSFGLWDNTECREIDCYSLSEHSEANGLTAFYIAKPTSVEAVPGILIPALEWLIAARAFGARGDSSHAEICSNTARLLLV